MKNKTTTLVLLALAWSTVCLPANAETFVGVNYGYPYSVGISIGTNIETGIVLQGNFSSNLLFESKDPSYSFSLEASYQSDLDLEGFVPLTLRYGIGLSLDHNPIASSGESLSILIGAHANFWLTTAFTIDLNLLIPIRTIASSVFNGVSPGLNISLGAGFHF